MEWRPHNQDRFKDSWALYDGNAGVIWVRQENDRWLANYVVGGNTDAMDIKYNQPIENVTTLEEAKAVGIMLMRMS